MSKAIRFAVGTWDGLSSNSWRLWNQGDDVYLSCRDNYGEIKWSFHKSGRSHVAFTAQAWINVQQLFPPGADRTWVKWDRPAEFAPGTVCAIAIDFFTSELPLSDCERADSVWRDVTMIEPAPDNFFTCALIFISTEGKPFRHPHGLPTINFETLSLPTLGKAHLVFTQEQLSEQKRSSLGRGYAAATAQSPIFEQSARILLHGTRDDGSPWVSELNSHRPTPDPLLLI